MTGISGVLPELTRTAQDGGSGNPGSLSTSLTAAAQAWQREMERQQQQTWFLPWLSTTDGEPDFQTVANNPTGMAARASTPVSSSLHNPTPEALGSKTQAKFERGGVRNSEAVYGHDAGCPLQRKNMGIAGSQREAVADVSLRNARLISPVSVSLRTNWTQVTTPGPDSVFEANFNVDATADGVADFRNKVGSASARSTTDYANSGFQFPLRVSCGWQDGQLTVWIGHDRGQGEVAAKLAQTIDRWLVMNKLAPAGFVINGEPLLRGGFVQNVVNSASEDSSDHLSGSITQVVYPRTYADFIPRRNT